MENTIVEDTHKLYTKVADKQSNIETLTETLVATAQSLVKELESQATLFAEAQKQISANEKFYRDTLHLLELSEGLSSADKTELYQLLDSAVHARRLGKDLLTGTGMPLNKVTNLFNQCSNTVATMNPNQFKVMDVNGSNKAKVNTLLKTINTTNLCIKYPNEGRYYKVRAVAGTQQYGLVKNFIETRKLSEKKFTKFVLQEETEDGTVTN